jgi:hypothetical protein
MKAARTNLSKAAARSSYQYNLALSDALYLLSTGINGWVHVAVHICSKLEDLRPVIRVGLI